MPDVTGEPLPEGTTTFYRPSADGLRGPSVPERVAVDLRIQGTGAELQLRTPAKSYRYEIDIQRVIPQSKAAARIRDRAWFHRALDAADVDSRLGF